jgi:integrase
MKGVYLSTVKPDTLTLKDLIENHYALFVLAQKKTGRETLAMLQAQFEEFSPRVIASLTVADFEAWRLSRKEEGTKSASLNRYRSALMSALNWAVRTELIESNPLARWGPLDEADSDPIIRSLTDDERARLYEALERREERLLSFEQKTGNHHGAAKSFADHVKPIILLALNTAIRRGSILSLTWGDVDFANMIITVRAANAKNSKTQRVPMNKTVQNVLEKWRGQSRDTSNDALLFPNAKTGEKMHDCRTAWETLMKDAGIENFRWHDMRHDVATRLRKKGTRLDTVQRNLGHASVKTTQRYTHIGPDEERAALELLDEDS